MAIDRKAYRADKKAYKSKVKANKDIVKSNKKTNKANKSAHKSHVKMVKQSDKKYKKSEKVAIKKDHQERVAREKPGFIGGKPPRMPGPKPMYHERAPQMQKMQSPTGDKPKRSDYKSSKPQRATGSTASHGRMEKLTNQVMIKPIDKHWLREKNHATSKQAKLNAQRGRHRGM